MKRLACALSVLVVVSLLGSCASFPSAAGMSRTISNPVLDANFPDPAVVKASEGYYYVYATQGEVDGKMQNIQVVRSRNLQNWQRVGDALPTKPVWASQTQDFWAPHVALHDGVYYLYYSAKPDIALADKVSGLCLAVATSIKPHGPFVDIGKPLQCGEGFINIDPMAFDDPATGKRLLYWGSGFGPIKVQELAQDRTSFAPGSKAIDLVATIPDEDPQNYQRLVEGAWVTRHRGYYYLFYSGDNCCGPKAHYAVMVARSKSATGPFRTLAAETGSANSVILEADSRWVAPGHNAVIKDATGRYLIFYHAVDARRSKDKDADDINTRRVMMLSELEWIKGWPQVRGK